MSVTAEQVIAALGLQPHPEGGWYRETWRDEAGEGGRSRGTAIQFLLEAGQRSQWHRVDATELWLHQGGGPLLLSIAELDAAVSEVRLGPAITVGEVNQAVVPPGAWQSACAGADWTLVACVVVPGFEFAGFEFAPDDWSPGRGA